MIRAHLRRFIGGGLGGPLRSLPQSGARAKPALETEHPSLCRAISDPLFARRRWSVPLSSAGFAGATRPRDGPGRRCREPWPRGPPRRLGDLLRDPGGGVRRQGDHRFRQVTVAEVAAPTFESLAREHPEWRGWLGVMRAALDEAVDPAWRHVVVVPSSAREPGAPWLAGASITLDERLARRWVRTLL